MTKAVLVIWGLWVAFNIVRVVLTPYSYFQVRDLALQNGQPPPQLSLMMAGAVRTLLEQACLFICPYIVYNSWLRRDGE
jgi:hypothetical protein